MIRLMPPISASPTPSVPGLQPEPGDEEDGDSEQASWNAGSESRRQAGDLHNRSHRPRPWHSRPCPWPAGLPEPRAHGRIADGGSRNRILERIRAVQRHMTRAGGACCKTVGSAYVWFEPNTCHTTPATTCENGPLAGISRLCGPFPLSRRVSPCRAVDPDVAGVHGRIADGVRACRAVGVHRRLFHGRPRTGRAGAA